MTSKFCVVGSPISQSLSPLLHIAAYERLRLDFSYDAHEVASGDLTVFLAGSDYQGVSVTMPLKSEAFELAGERSTQAGITRAANTLTRTSDGWSASNTDIYGLTQALGQILPPSRTAIIGAGATANSSLAALAELFPSTKVEILARDEKAGSEAVNFGLSLGLAVSSEKISAERLASSDLVLSLVPTGSFENVWADVAALSDAPSGWLFDAVYNPWPTLPARSWEGERVISGLEMLIWQAIEQVKLFALSVGHDIELDNSEIFSVMKAAVSDK